ncbi:pentatricopeptide repeat-containing protein At1g56690, mitochondrial [Selaginella moellendorffii]|nr:pentatricopeptide repeat-containing protein At1g56690, mitochondrial [Selaginella moellendorffii]|eukprot:XP_002966861.2 pentatricopeptide repeat-containing protein At1g56690, mitochondrial [Selaginella moellendorffii]
MVRVSLSRLLHFRSLLRAVAGDYKEGSLSEAVEFIARSDRGSSKDAYYFLLRRCIKEKGLEEGRRLQGLIRKRRYDHDGFLGNLLIKLFGVCNSTEEARYAYDALPTSNSMIALNNMLEAYIVNGKIEDAREFFDGAAKRDVKTWNIMLSAYTQRGLMDEAKELFKLAKDPAVDLWVTMIEGYARAGMPQRAFTIFRASPGHERVWGAMIAAFAASGDLATAKEMVHRMKNPSVASCTPLFEAYLKAGEISDAQDVFNKMSTSYEAPWTTLLMAYLDRAMFSEAKRIFKLMPNRDPVAWNAMIRAHSLHGEIEEARILFEGMGAQRNLESWNTIMAAYNRNGQAGDTYKIFKGMIQRYVKPDKNSFLTVMESCTNLDDAGKVAKEFRWSSCLRDLELNNLLLKTFLRLGSLEEATSIFHSIEEKNLESWSLMVSGLATKGKYAAAVSLLSNMVLRGVMPDNAIFTSMVSACRSLGRTDEGASYLRSMVADFEVYPVLEDYLCVMELLKPKQAEELLNSMPFEPDYDVWKTFLGVCQRAGDKELTEVAEKALRRLCPIAVCV